MQMRHARRILAAVLIVAGGITAYTHDAHAADIYHGPYTNAGCTWWAHVNRHSYPLNNGNTDVEVYGQAGCGSSTLYDAKIYCRDNAYPTQHYALWDTGYTRTPGFNLGQGGVKTTIAHDDPNYCYTTIYVDTNVQPGGVGHTAYGYRWWNP
jgi:hypothetical protein